MNRILTNLTSRKFLTVLAAQIASVCAIFAPELEHQVADAGMRIVGLVVLLAAALGYGKIEGAVDRERLAAQADLERAAMDAGFIAMDTDVEDKADTPD